MVLSPPLPGAGRRVLSTAVQGEYWYQAFHQLDLAEQLVDGRADAVRAYLRHFWSHWSAPGWDLDGADLARLVDGYRGEGSFVASIKWYRASAGTVGRSLAEAIPALDDRIRVPTRVVLPGQDPLFPMEWADNLDAFFADVSVVEAPGAGHFVPVEDPFDFAAAVRDLMRR